MTDWLGTFLHISAHRGEMLFQPLPAWVWTRDGSAICWANPAGALILGAQDLDQVSRLTLPPGSALRRDVNNIARRLGQGGTLARLRFFKGSRSLSLTCRCERIKLPDGQAAILVDAKEDFERRNPPGDADLAAYLTFGDHHVVILDGSRQVLAASGVELDAGELPVLAASDDPRSAEVDIGDGRARIRYIRAGRNANSPVVWWIEQLADPLASSEGSGDAVAPDDRGEPEVTPQESDLPEAGFARDGNADRQDDAENFAEAALESEPGGHPQDSEAEPDIGQPKIPGQPVGDGDGDDDGDFSRQARMLRAALRKSTGTVVELESEPVPDALANLPKKPVRFLWQTDAEGRFLFVSPGLEQLVGRSSQIIGERWCDIADRMRLDPVGRVSQALAGQDTWSGYTAWWPTEDRTARIPAELTALPVFAIDQSFQGYRGFGVLKPAEALSAAAFEKRFPGDPLKIPEDEPRSGETDDGQKSPEDGRARNVVPIREELRRLPDFARLSPQERSAFDEIALALRTHDELAQSVSAQSQGDAPARPQDDAASEQSGDHSHVSRETGHEYGEYSTDANDPDFLASLPDDDDDFPPDADEIYTEDFDALILADEGKAAARDEETPERAPNVQEKVSGDSDSSGGGASPAVSDDDVVAGKATPKSGAEPLLKTVGELQSVLNISADGILILDSTGTVLQLNAIAQALYGEIDDSLVGRPLTDLLDEDSRQLTIDYLEGVRENGVQGVLKAGREVSVRRGKDIIPVFMKIGPLADHDDEARFAVVIRDISRWKNVEADLIAGRQAAEQASAQKSEFLARVSHEIRTPLNAIIGFAEVMIEERFGPIENERYREYLRDIRTSGEHVVSLVNDLLDISKIEAGKLDLTFAAVPLNDLVRECITLMQPQANRSKVIVRSSLAGHLPSIVADLRTMRQVVLNLLSNSIKFTGSGGQVIVSTSLTEQGDALLRVRDTGTGMSEDDLARALEPFRQLSTSRIRDETGTGLGLPLTKALVEANRAIFDITSARGEGTIVQITFPATRVLSD